MASNYPLEPKIKGQNYDPFPPKSLIGLLLTTAIRRRNTFGVATPRQRAAFYNGSDKWLCFALLPGL
jgi:hypothetical protein